MELEPITSRIRIAAPKIFNFDYPIWDAQYKIELETKFLRHFYMKEIGAETLGLWKLFLEDRLNMIMPYYNQLYETVAREYDYMTDTDITAVDDVKSTTDQDTNNITVTENDVINTNVDRDETHTDSITTNIGNQDTTGNVKVDSKTLQSDFPQANYSGTDYGSGLDETESNTNTTQNVKTNNTTTGKVDTVNTSDRRNEIDNDTKSTLKGEVDTTKVDHGVNVRRGANGSRSFNQLLMERRETLINIDQMIINDCKDLFMYVY